MDLKFSKKKSEIIKRIEACDDEALLNEIELMLALESEPFLHILSNDIDKAMASVASGHVVSEEDVEKMLDSRWKAKKG